MTAWQLLININNHCHFMSRERTGKASNSELKRWFNSKAVQINGERVRWDDAVKFPVTEFFLFPKNKVTLV